METAGVNTGCLSRQADMLLSGALAAKVTFHPGEIRVHIAVRKGGNKLPRPSIMIPGPAASFP